MPDKVSTNRREIWRLSCAWAREIRESSNEQEAAIFIYEILTQVVDKLAEQTLNTLQRHGVEVLDDTGRDATN